MKTDPTMSDAEYAAMVDPETPLDSGIVRAVRVLHEAGIETVESCEGGPGHSYAEPTVRFRGDGFTGWQALAAAHKAVLPVWALRKTWYVEDGEPVGPLWEIVLRTGRLTT